MRIKQLPKRSGEVLFDVIVRRDGLHSTMMTTNRPFGDWGKLKESKGTEGVYAANCATQGELCFRFRGSVRYDVEQSTD